MTTQKSTEEQVKEILSNSNAVLAKVDAAEIFNIETAREFPVFRFDEIGDGSLLGKGGFSAVKEIQSFHLDVVNAKEKQTADKGARDDSPDDIANFLTGKKDDEPHYDVATARSFMSKNCMRFGSSRYAIKKLKPELGQVDRARGAIDLAIEIKFLSVIWHPNIIKMRGYSDTPKVDYDTFILLDRLYGTFEDRIEEWNMANAANKGCCGPSKNDPEVLKLLKERLLVAYDLSAAFQYLHGHSLLYRDIKPENIGFDVRGDVKLFDFGLCKNLGESDKNPKGYGYNLSAKTGSIPYMAPEIALGKPYDREADVYSFSILLWEVLSLDWAFNGYDAKTYFIRACAQHERPQLQKDWPIVVRTLIKEGWDKDPTKRPRMKRIGTLLRGELEDMIPGDDSIVNRTQHMMNRSRRSMRGMDSSRGRRTSLLATRSVRASFTGGDT